MDSHLRCVFGITSDEYYEILKRQDGVCAICKQPETRTFKGSVRRLAVDHDHSTGKIRGLLCGACNTGLGLFDDDPEILKTALGYLNEHTGF